MSRMGATPPTTAVGRSSLALLTRRLCWALAVLLLARLALMAWMPLMDTTEGRYGEIGRKMAELNDWITPWHDHGVPFWGKPPLSFWITAVSFKLLGVNEFAARLPHLLCSLVTAACVWNVARQRAAHEGWIAASVLASMVLFYVGGAAVMTDSALVMGTTIATCSAWLAITGSREQQRRLHRWLAFAGAAIGVLAKGPLALVLIGTPLLLWALWCRQWVALWNALPWVRGLLLMTAVSLPWFVMAEHKTPGFLEYFFVGEHFHRFVTPGWAGDLYGSAHRQPKGMVWVYTLGATLPWSLLLPALALWRRFGSATSDVGAAQGVDETQTQRFVLLFALMPLVFFTGSSNIIWTYALPALPGLAWWAARWMGRRGEQGLRWSTAGVVATTVLLGAAALVADGAGRFEQGSGKEMAAACEAAAGRHAPQWQPSAQDPLLVVAGRRSLSADFYTHGKAERFKNLGDALAQWPRQGRCLAWQPEFPVDIEALGLRSVEELGLMHGRRVVWAVPTGTAP